MHAELEPLDGGAVTPVKSLTQHLNGVAQPRHPFDARVPSAPAIVGRCLFVCPAEYITVVCDRFRVVVGVSTLKPCSCRSRLADEPRPVSAVAFDACTGDVVRIGSDGVDQLADGRSDDVDAWTSRRSVSGVSVPCLEVLVTGVVVSFLSFSPGGIVVDDRVEQRADGPSLGSSLPSGVSDAGGRQRDERDAIRRDALDGLAEVHRVLGLTLCRRSCRR